MFPILKGTNRVITKGYYFPSHISKENLFLHIMGINESNIVIIEGASGQFIYQSNTELELRFPVLDHSLRYAQKVNIRFYTPTGQMFDVDGFVITPDTVMYIFKPTDSSQVGNWRYEISLVYNTEQIYNLQSGYFEVKLQ